MFTRNETNFLLIDSSGSVHGNVSKVEYEELERSATGVIKAKFLAENLPSEEAPSIKESIPEIFYIDTRSNNILNKDSIVIATTTIIKQR